ncbi:MAG: glycosyltransferase, partial [archaeon]|nr:glycosyltransferase [archaeon]
MDGISIILPCYKGEKVIAKTLERTAKTLEELKRDYEIIVVVDGQLDASYEIALEASKQNPKIKAFAYEQNKGKGFALKHGAQFISKELTLF